MVRRKTFAHLLVLLGCLVFWVQAKRHNEDRNSRHQLDFLHEPGSAYIAFDGKRTVLKCQPSLSNSQVSWRFNGSPIEDYASVFGDSIKVTRNRVAIRLPKMTSSAPNDLADFKPLLTALKDGSFQCVIQLKGQALLSQPAKLLVAGIEPFPPDVNVTLTVTEDNIAVIHCSPPHSVPIAVTEFFVNGTLIDRSKGRYYLMPSGDLQIFKARISDSGVYRCVAHNPFLGEKRNASHFVHLRVKRINHTRQNRNHHALRWSVSPKQTVNPVSGTNVTLECVANGLTPPNVTWTRLNAELPKWRTIPVGGNLVIMTINSHDDGTYVCTASGSDGQITSKTSLVVHEPPRIKKPLQDVLLQDGQSFSLGCEVTGSPLPLIQWVFNSRPIDDDLKKSLGVVISGNDDEKLSVMYASKDKHFGIFQCFATNELGTEYARSNANSKDIVKFHEDNNDFDAPKPDSDAWRYLNVDDRPKGTRHPPLGDCSGVFHNKTLARYKWCLEKLEKLREADHNLKGEDEDAHDGDMDMFTNVKKVTIKQKAPSKPEITRMSESAVMVRWSFNDGHGSLPVTFFKIQYRDIHGTGSEAMWQTVPSDISPHINAYTVFELKPDATYKFRVLAAFANMDNTHGPASNQFKLLKNPPEGLKPTIGPTIVALEAASPSALNIRWKYLENYDKKIEGFFIHYRESSSAGSFHKVTALGASTREHTLTHLLPSSSYEVKMQCFNEFGTSQFSTLVTNRTMDRVVHHGPTTPNVNDVDNNISTNFSGFNDDKTLYCVLGIAVGALVLVVVVVIVLCFMRTKQRKQSTNVIRRRSQKPKERHPKANSLANLNHHSFNHDYGNPYGNYQKNGVNGTALNNGIGLKTAMSNGFVFKDSTEDKHEIHIRINPLLEDGSYEGRSRTLSSSTFLGSRSVSTRDIMRRTSSVSQHSLHNNHNATNNLNTLNNNANNVAVNNNDAPNNQFVLNTVERGRRGRMNGNANNFNPDEAHPNVFRESVRINHRSSSFTRLNGTLERKRRSRTDLLAMDNGTITRRDQNISRNEECEREPMLNTSTRCNGSANGTAANGHVVMQSSC